jgi:hypothetical protein
MKPPHAAPDVLLASNGHIYVNAASLPLADRVGCRVIRCIALTPREQEEFRRRVGSLASDLLVGLTAKRGGLR